MKNIKLGTILWLLAIGSCSIGVGLSGNPCDGFIVFGICIGIYALIKST